MPIKRLDNEQELLLRIIAGDERAFKEIFDGYFDGLSEFVYKITKSLEETETIVQDSFIKLWLRRDRLEPVKDLSSYLFVISRNTTLDFLRKQSKERAILLELGSKISEFEEGNDTDGYPEAYFDLIDKAVSKLPAQAQKVYRLSREEKRKHDEIAECLNISPETVKKHIQYALAFIKRELVNASDLNKLPSLLAALIIKYFFS